MGEKRLTGLALLYIHKNIIIHNNIENIINRFAIMIKIEDWILSCNNSKNFFIFCFVLFLNIV